MADNVYICGLPGGVDEEGLKGLFASYGSVVSVKIISKPGGDWTAGLCRLSSPAEAQVAIQTLNGQVPEGCTTALQVRLAADNTSGGVAGKSGSTAWPPAGAASPRKNVYISGLPGGLDDELVAAIFSQYGTITSLKVLSKPDADWTAAIVDFSAEDEAEFVVTNVNGQIPEGLTAPIQVRYASKGGGKADGKGAPAGRFTPYNQPPPPASAPPAWGAAKGGRQGGGNGAGKGSQGYTMKDVVKSIEESDFLPGGDGKDWSKFTEVYVQGLPPDCELLDLYKIFAPFGQISCRGVMIMQHKASAFINFLAPESAELAIATLNGCELPDGKTIRVEVKKPTVKGKSGGKGTAFA